VDLYDSLSRNRRHLIYATALLMAVIMTISGLAILILRDAFDIAINFWFLWTMFWLLFAVYVVLRYALGGMWLLNGVKTLPASKRDICIDGSVMAAALASGMTGRVRIFEIEDDDINAFSLSLPDASFAIFLTEGIAWKVEERERVAIIAHEIAHMQAGDTAVHTLIIRMAGRRSLKKMIRGLPNKGFVFARYVSTSVIAFLFATIVFIELFGTANDPGLGLSPAAFFWLFLLSLFVMLMLLLPLASRALLRFFLDRDREYNADMHAVFLTRDPDAVYNALRLAAEDVRDVIFLPACFDALLFNPVVDYSSYRPYRTQPTMSHRMQRLCEAFPMLILQAQSKRPR
jgi:Zn-dependent protease with chaperone function